MEQASNDSWDCHLLRTPTNSAMGKSGTSPVEEQVENTLVYTDEFVNSGGS
jgi:hypothetical protein